MYSDVHISRMSRLRFAFFHAWVTFQRFRPVIMTNETRGLLEHSQETVDLLMPQWQEKMTANRERKKLKELWPEAVVVTGSTSRYVIEREH